MNASSSGQSGYFCQKNESTSTVVPKPRSRPSSPAGIISRWMPIRPVRKRKMVFVARKIASSERKIIPAMVSRHRDNRHRFLYVLEVADWEWSWRRHRSARVDSPNANMLDSVRDA